MPGSTIVHVAVFAAGAILGAGAVALTHSPKPGIDRTRTKKPGSIVEVGPSGSLKLARQGVEGDILRYGNPGGFILYSERY